jgi:SAM-dependent methyltransferase
VRGSCGSNERGIPLISRISRRITARLPSSSRSQQATFTDIFLANAWRDPESVSGPGSTRARAADVRAALVSLLDVWSVRSIVDAPCGDFNWMRDSIAERDLSYTGVDIVAPLIARNTALHGAGNRQFLCADMTRVDLPQADLILCRDGLVHLSFADARAVLRNFRRSGARYLLATTFVDRSRNRDVPTGGWRALNLQAAPFNFPPPLSLIDEQCTHSDGIYLDKRLGLWELASIDR